MNTLQLLFSTIKLDVVQPQCDPSDHQIAKEHCLSAPKKQITAASEFKSLTFPMHFDMLLKTLDL